MAFSPDGSRIAGASSSNHTQGVIVDALTGETLLTLPEREVPINCVGYSPNGKIVAWGLSGLSAPVFQGFSAPNNPKDLLLLTDSKTGEVLRSLTGHMKPVNHVAFSPDGKLLASASNDKTVRLWEVATGKEARVLREDPPATKAIAWSSPRKVDTELRCS